MTAAVRDILAWKKRDASRPPPYLKYRSSKLFIILTICFASFTDIFLYGLIIPVVPFALLNRVGVPEGNVQHWVSVLLAVYAAALIVSPPIAGWLTDHYKSRRVPFVLALFALAGATIMLCLGTTIGVLVAGRFLQGVAGGVVVTVGLALLADTVGPKEIGQAVGWLSLSISVANLVAPLLGGVVYARGGYYAVYYMAFALIVADIILRLLLIERKTAKKWQSSDEEIQERLPGSPHNSEAGTSVPADYSPVTASSLSSKKKRFSTPPVLALLSSYRLLSAIWCTLAIALLMTAWDAVLPLRVYNLFGWSSLGAGLMFLPLLLPSFAAPLVGKYSDTRGPRLPMFLCFLLGCPFVTLLLLVDHSGTRQVVLLCSLLALAGFSFPMGITAVLVEITNAVDAEEKRRGEGCFGEMGAYAQAKLNRGASQYGLFTTAYAGGMLVGPLWAGLVETSAGWTTMCWSLGLLSAVTAIPAGLLTGGLLWKRRQNEPSGDVEDLRDTAINPGADIQEKEKPSISPGS
ncbi:MAG: hypothetical protein Q9195_000794 [Heterodermia aff. obscurata]